MSCGVSSRILVGTVFDLLSKDPSFQAIIRDSKHIPIGLLLLLLLLPLLLLLLLLLLFLVWMLQLHAAATAAAVSLLCCTL